MSKFNFTQKQIDTIESYKGKLNLEESKNWIAKEENAEIECNKILNSTEFINGRDIEQEALDYLFRQMKFFVSNRNLSNLLYRDDIKGFNSKLRYLIHSNDPLPDRVNEFFKIKGMGIQTLSQFLLASNTTKYPVITSATKDAMNLSPSQEEAALEDALEFFSISGASKYSDRTLIYLSDFIIFKIAKDISGLEKYNLVNNLLWYVHMGGITILDDSILELLETKKQVILYGPPGTGKTYFAKQYAVNFIGLGDDFE